MDEKMIFFGITTFKKNNALEVLLQSLVDHNYTNSIVHISDDNCLKPDKNGITSLDVCKKFKNKFYKLILQYNEKSSMLGISISKNRNIDYFLKNCDNAWAMVLLDDDLKIVHPGIEDHLKMIREKYNQHHICGYWTDESAYETSKLVGLSGQQWSKDFPIVMENPHITWNRGTQGVFIYVTKELALAAGYFRRFPYFYGTEHSEYSARLNALCGWVTGTDDGEQPLFPMMKRSERFFHGQFIANDYSIDHEKIEINMKKYREYLSDTRRGIGLKVEESSIPRKGEKILEINIDKD